MPVPTLEFTQQNVHRSLRAARVVAKRRPDIANLNEAHNLVRWAAALTTYRVTTAKPVVKPRVSLPGERNVSNDTITLVRPSLEHLGEWSQQVSQQVDSTPAMAPDRWFLATMVRHHTGMPIAVFNVHPNANAGNHLRDPKDGNHPVVREYRESVIWLGDMVDFYKMKGYGVLISGDFNLPKHVEVPWTPFARLRALGIKVVTRGIDGIGWDESAFVLDKITFHDKGANFSDHPGLTAHLQVLA